MVEVLNTEDDAKKVFREIDAYLSEKYGVFLIGAIAVGYAPKNGFPQKVSYQVINLQKAPTAFGVDALKGMFFGLQKILGGAPQFDEPKQPPRETRETQ